MSYEFKCPACGKKLFSYELREQKYGKIVNKCKKCGADYIDPRYHELAIDGIPQAEFSYVSYVLMIAVGAFLLWRASSYLGVKQLGVPNEMQWVMPGLFFILGIASIVFAIIGMISIKTGAKKRKFEKLLAESKERMRDPSYIYTLQKLGYKLPEIYTNDYSQYYYGKDE